MASAARKYVVLIGAEEQNAKRTPEEQAELDRREEEFRLYVEEYYRNNQQ